MTYEEAKTIRTALDEATATTGKVMQTFPKGAFGMTPDEVKFSPEFIAARTAFRRAEAAQREFTAHFLKVFAKEYRSERAARWA